MQTATVGLCRLFYCVNHSSKPPWQEIVLLLALFLQKTLHNPFLLAKTDIMPVALTAVDLAQGGLQLEADSTSKETKSWHRRNQAEKLRRDWGGSWVFSSGIEYLWPLGDSHLWAPWTLCFESGDLGHQGRPRFQHQSPPSPNGVLSFACKQKGS